MDREAEEQMDRNLLKRRKKRSGKKGPQPSAASPGSVSQKEWFYTFMYMNIPIAGWLYLRRLSRDGGSSPLKDFAKAYLHYKLVFSGIALALLIILCIIGALALDRLLAYMEML